MIESFGIIHIFCIELNFLFFPCFRFLESPSSLPVNYCNRRQLPNSFKKPLEQHEKKLRITWWLLVFQPAEEIWAEVAVGEERKLPFFDICPFKPVRRIIVGNQILWQWICYWCLKTNAFWLKEGTKEEMGGNIQRCRCPFKWRSEDDFLFRQGIFTPLFSRSYLLNQQTLTQ